jgi:hypothetical protein
VTRILISSKALTLSLDLNDSPTAQEFIRRIPFESTVQTWGDEVYFETPVSMKLEKGSRAKVDVGDVGYWPPGRAMCIFFGPTPASEGDEPRAASPVNLIGRVAEEAARFGAFRDGEAITVRAQGGSTAGGPGRASSTRPPARR